MRKYYITEKISRYEIGNPIETEAVVNKGDRNCPGDFKYFNIEIGNEIKLNYKMSKDDKVYGLGQNMRGINKRGYIYESFCSDDPCHTPEKKSLYGAHNFFIIEGSNTFGMFIDFPSKVTFDVGYNVRSNFNINIEGADTNIYIIEGESLKEIIHEFLKIIGKSYVPPKWAFGYIQSRWGYKTGEEVEEIANKFIEKGIPLDGICLDLDYMDDYKDFSLSEERFRGFDSLNKRLKENGIKIIPIIDAGVKIEEGYDIYEEGIRGNYFAVDKNNDPFVAAVWPGKVHFPDFLNKDARLWFGRKYKELIDNGVEGFWNDMNEPAIFYSEGGIEEAYRKIDELKKLELNVDSFFKLMDIVNNLKNNVNDYKSFYHKTENGLVNHYDVHNIYGYNMTKAASEGFDTIDENKRFLLFSRASYIGAHRYGGIWTGDNSSWWEHIVLNMKMMPSLNMCGFLYSGADTCGFGSNIDPELAVRWNQLSIFTPLYRNHSALGTKYQEPFAFDLEVEKIIKNTIKFRYAMIPYLYSEFMKAVNNSEMFIKQLGIEYEDKLSKEVEDQLLIGDSIMIAPIYEPNKRGRYVYTPEDMLLWKVKDHTSKDFEIIKKGHNYIDVDINEFSVFIRRNKMLVLGEPAQSTKDINSETLNIIAFVESEAEYTLYDDDGISNDYKKGVNSSIDITISIDRDKHNINAVNKGNLEVKRLNVTIITGEGKIISDVVNL
ncbi:MAG: glycoside hydrolase family 31 protein [Clostridium sp.]|uniref:TIM-barrel domain-containing protein n=1 Tax=Clostridium sp. TaxID=1506 RepID=UPI002906FDB3|nr:TIM-barrel domain-containing protein [Clostridium sp.]MDU5110572.1 glycoside hydrolase family 31 protein [Clostridium sp.]